MNLDSSPDRWKQIQKEFKDSSMRLRRFSAVKCSSGGIGNALTFLKILKLARKNKIPNVLILEDDCLPAKGWEENWIQVKKWLDTHEDQWDVYSGGAYAWNDLFQDITDFIGLNPSEIAHVGDNIIFKYPIVSHGGHWIYYNHKSYTKLINYFENLIHFRKRFIDYHFMNVDVNHMFFNTISSYPFIAYQQTGYSIVEKKKLDREKRIRRYEKHVGRYLTKKNRAHTKRSATRRK